MSARSERKRLARWWVAVALTLGIAAFTTAPVYGSEVSFRVAPVDGHFVTGFDYRGDWLRASIATDLSPAEGTGIGSDPKAFESIGRIALQPTFGEVSIGIGYRRWVRIESETGRQEGGEPFVAIGWARKLKRFDVSVDVSYGKSGTGYGAMLGYDLGAYTLGVGYRALPINGWYAGPVIGISGNL